MNPGGGEEVHFEFDAAISFAFRALPSLIVEGELGGRKATCAGIRKLGKELTDGVEEFDVSSGTGSGCLSNRCLIDLEAMFDAFKSAGGFKRV